MCGSQPYGLTGYFAVTLRCSFLGVPAMHMYVSEHTLLSIA
jgi:hypothetical protein